MWLRQFRGEHQRQPLIDRIGKPPEWLKIDEIVGHSRILEPFDRPSAGRSESTILRGGLVKCAQRRSVILTQ